MHMKSDRQRGFTLVEMIVAVALFSIVMLVSVSALLALVNANRKARALESVMNNLNIALDGMVRAMRMGSQYHCGAGSITQTADCAGGGTQVAFEAFGGDYGDESDQWVYTYDPQTKRLYRSTEGGLAPLPITSPEITIDDMKFYVVGSTRGTDADPPDTVQPKIVVTIKGTAGADKVNTRTTFSIQATAVQRILDL